MRKFKFEKIVRDLIPEMMIQKGAKLNVKNLEKKDVIFFLKEKLLEELQEVNEACDNVSLIEELADLYEVIRGIICAIGSDLEELERVRKQKFDSKGGFLKAPYIESIELEDDSKLINYYLNNPKKYPEIK